MSAVLMPIVAIFSVLFIAQIVGHLTFKHLADTFLEQLSEELIKILTVPEVLPEVFWNV
jgi:uncharacterized membrane protein YGL010W